MVNHIKLSITSSKLLNQLLRFYYKFEEIYKNSR